MGVVRRADESLASEFEQLRRNLVACGGTHRRKHDGELKGLESKLVGDPEEKVVCVTGGVSFLAAAIVDELLLHGYSVRVLVDNPEDVNKLAETMRSNGNVSVVTAEITDVNGLTEAFDGCRGVFHTSSSIDPAGVTGYTKTKSAVEMRITECVMEACARAPTVRNCVVTSSLLACIWRDHGGESAGSTVVADGCWSNSQLCRDKKLWYALGKLKAEKIAWRIAEETGLNLATICPGLITGPDFHRRNSTATMAYLKGAREMYANGLLATVDVSRLAKAHVCVYDEMKDQKASGRYICYDQVIATAEAAEELTTKTGVAVGAIVEAPAMGSSSSCQLSDKKLCDLMSRRAVRCCSERTHF